MSKFYKLFISILFLGFIQLSHAQSDFLDGVVFVKIKESELNFFEGSKQARGGVSLEQLLDVNSIENFESKFPLNKRESKVSTYSHEVRKIYRLKFSKSEDVLSKIASLKETDMFDIVEPSYIFEIQDTRYYPNDPFADTIVGQGVSHQLLVHDFYKAWGVEKGDPNIRIGIVDTGINYDQEDALGNLYYNHNDSIDGINNDGDDYFGDELIDNFRGWDAADWDNDPTLGSGSFHGAAMTSIIASEPDNNVGMSGVAFNVKYEPYKAAPDSSSNSLTAGYDAIYIAALQGCKVINCSWGRTAILPEIFEDLLNQITYDFDVLIVAAAGNEGNTEKYFPASYDAVISTSALVQDTTFAYFTSNYNYEVDVAALGHKVRQANASQPDAYYSDQGTSSASAIVSGLAGLVRSHFPEMTAAQAKKQIISTGDYIDTIPGNEAYANRMGKMINPYKALTDTVSPGLEVVGQSINNGDTLFVKTGEVVDFDVAILNLLRPSNGVSYKLTAMTDNFEFIDSLGVLEDIASIDTLLGLGTSVQMNLFATTNSIEDFVARIEFTDDTGYRDHQYVQFSLSPSDVTGLTFNKKIDMTVHPIPFKDNMKISGDFSKDVVVQLFDLNGTRYDIDYSYDFNTISVKSISDLPIGTYLIKVNDLDASSVVKTTKLN